MTSYDIGPLRVLVSERAIRAVDTKDFTGATRSAAETPAACAGPGGLLLELVHQRWESGGIVTCVSRGDSPRFDRLLHGGRLGIQVRDDGTDTCELGLMRWRHDTGWGNVGRADREELDALGAGDTWTLLTGLGALGIATREELFEDGSRRRNFVAAHFLASDPLVPIAAYVLTRVLPAIEQEPS